MPLSRKFQLGQNICKLKVGICILTALVNFEVSEILKESFAILGQLWYYLF